jgi:hypothetical protein
MEICGHGVGLVESNGAPMRVPAGHRIVRVVCTLLGATADASAVLTLGVRALASPAQQRAEHVLGTVSLARPDEPRTVTPGRRSGTSAAVERVLFAELADARGVLDVLFVVTCAASPPEPFDAASVEARLFADAARTERATVLRPSRRYYASAVTAHGGAPVDVAIAADSGCTVAVTGSGVEVTTLTSAVAAMRTEARAVGAARYAASLTTIPVGDTALGVDVPAGYVLQRAAANVALPLLLRGTSGELSAAQVLERYGEYPTITVRGSTLAPVGGAYTLSASANADVTLAITEVRVGGAKVAFEQITRTVPSREPPAKAAFWGTTPWNSASRSVVVRVSTATNARCLVASVARATVRTTAGAEFRARATISAGDVTIALPESTTVYSATVTGIACEDGTRAAELTAWAPQLARLVARTRGGDALVYGTGVTSVSVEAHRLHGVGALVSSLTPTNSAGFSYSGGVLTVSPEITTDGTHQFATFSGTATADDGTTITITNVPVSVRVIGTSTRLVDTPVLSVGAVGALGVEVEASAATASCLVTRLRAPLLGAPRLEPTPASVAVRDVNGSGAVTETGVVWAPQGAYSPSGTPELVLTNVGCVLDGRKTTISSLAIAMRPTTMYALELVATVNSNFGHGAAIVDGAAELPSPLTAPFQSSFGTVGTVYLELKVAGSSQPIVLCGDVGFTDTGNHYLAAQDYAKSSAAQQELLVRGTTPYWRLVPHGASTVLGVFVGASVSVKSVSVGVCGASGGRVAQPLVYTKP